MGGFRGSVSARWVKAEMHITCLLHAVDPPARRATGTSCWYRGSASPSPRTGKSGLPFIDTCTSPSIRTRRRARARGVALEELAKAPARKNDCLSAGHFRRRYRTARRRGPSRPGGRLCEAEMRQRGLPTSAVTAGGEQEAPDGGLDVRVALPPSTVIDGFVSRPATGFQVKKSDMPRKATGREMRPKGRVRSVIRQLAAEAGAKKSVMSGTRSLMTGRCGSG